MNEERSSALRELVTNRTDFMKRWFAIAISVGFATALSNMPWLKYGIIFDTKLSVDWEQINQAVRLVTATVATILSWDGYFKSIRNKPLEDGLRFGIDVSLVAAYLILLLTSKFEYFWLWMHAGAFIVYCWWDFLSIRRYPQVYVTAKAPKDYVPTLKEVYRGCFNGNPNIYKGPAITLMWPIYFFSLAISNKFVLDSADRGKPSVTFLYALLVICGLFLYRHDKSAQFSTKYRSAILVIGAGLIFALSFIFRQIGD